MERHPTDRQATGPSNLEVLKTQGASRFLWEWPQISVNSEKWGVASLMTSAVRPYTFPTVCLNTVYWDQVWKAQVFYMVEHKLMDATPLHRYFEAGKPPSEDHPCQSG